MLYVVCKTKMFEFMNFTSFETNFFKATVLLFVIAYASLIMHNAYVPQNYA